MITWCRMADYLLAAQTAGRKIIAIADSDGQVSARLDFNARLRRDWIGGSKKLIDRANLARYYLKLRLHGSRSHDQEFIRSAELSERVIFASEGARRKFSLCLTHYDRHDLLNRLRVVPYAVDSAFLTQDLSQQRGRRAIAIGRWVDPQKNAGSLAKALARYYRQGATWEVMIVGNGAATFFSKVAARTNRLRLAERLPPARIAELLATSRVLLCPSYWEGCPIVAFEALATGCTLVSTPLPSVTALIDDGRRGTESASYRPEDFVRAMVAEFSAWDSGLRSSVDLSRQWRTTLECERICEGLLN